MPSERPALDHPSSDPTFVAGLRPIPSRPAGTPAPWPATDISGARPDGTPIEVRICDIGRPILVVFLATHCDGCDDYWRGLTDEHLEATADDPALDTSAAGDLAAALGGVVPVIVTRGPGVQEATDVAAAAAGIRDTPVVMSDQAWLDYRVTSYPFFVLVDPASRRIIGETVGFGWADVLGMIQAQGH